MLGENSDRENDEGIELTELIIIVLLEDILEVIILKVLNSTSTMHCYRPYMYFV